jgi:hypothetical protein
MPLSGFACSDYAHVLFSLHMRLWVRPASGIPCALFFIFEGRPKHCSGANSAAGIRPHVFALFEDLNQDRFTFEAVRC